VPLAPAVMVIQEAPLEAVQEQPEPAVTLTLPLPLLELNEALVADSVYVQAVAPAWLTLNVWPAIVIVPERDVVDELVATE
jgi:hypothetical protein